MVINNEAFVEYLRLAGNRVTPERIEIAREVFKLSRHFDADTLFVTLHEKNKSASRATVYRTLALLVKGGMLKESGYHDGRKVYEHVFRWKPHGHLNCVNCNEVEEYDDGLIDFLTANLCEPHGFKPIHYQINVRGWCRKCLKKQKKGKRKGSNA